MASRASSRLVGFRGFLFFEGSLEDMEHREVLRAIGLPLTLDDINQGRYQDGLAADVERNRFTAQAVEGTGAVDLAGEIDLELGAGMPRDFVADGRDQFAGRAQRGERSGRARNGVGAEVAGGRDSRGDLFVLSAAAPL